MAGRTRSERSERAAPFAFALVTILSVVLLPLFKVKLAIESALSPAIDVFGILLGFLVGVRALLKDHQAAEKHSQQSGLAERLDHAFTIALRLGFIALALSLGNLLLRPMLHPAKDASNALQLVAQLVDGLWLGSVVGGGWAMYVAMSTAFLLMMGRPKKPSSSPKQSSPTPSPDGPREAVSVL